MTPFEEDPVFSILQFAYKAINENNLIDVEDAIHSAAFALYGPDEFNLLAIEAFYYHTNKNGNQIDALEESHRRRSENRTLGTTQSSIWPYT